jgi:hypothetical protein
MPSLYTNTFAPRQKAARQAIANGYKSQTITVSREFRIDLYDAPLSYLDPEIMNESVYSKKKSRKETPTGLSPDEQQSPQQEPIVEQPKKKQPTKTKVVMSSMVPANMVSSIVASTHR